MASQEGKNHKGYFGMGRVLSIIFAIIPVTAWLFGVIQSCMDHRYINAIIRFFFGFNIIWILDLIWMIVFGRVCHFLILF